MNDLIQQLFANLDAWRHFPAYQLERRADIFFSLYLADYLKSAFRYDVQAIIPEFPLRVGTLKKGSEKLNKSYKADYLCILKTPRKVLLIELKTDPESRRGPQDTYLQEARHARFLSLLRGLRQIYHATNARPKYRRLLEVLEKVGAVSAVTDHDFQIESDDLEIEITYLQPQGEGDNIISFHQFAEFVGKKQDTLSQRFSISLKRWANVKAGANGG